MILKKIFYGEDPQATAKDPRAFYWPDSDQKRRELYSVRRNHPDIYESVYQCRPGQRVGSIFLESDFVYYLAPSGLHMGLVDPEVRKFLERFSVIVAAWDTAFEAKTESNFTVGIVAGLLSCTSFHRNEDPQVLGECESHMDVYILDLLKMKLPWGDLPREFRRMHRKWGVHLHVVEKRGAGISLYQSMPTVGIRVEGVDIKEGKRARAIEGVEAGSTQGWFRQHRVYLPFGSDWLDDYKTELKDFIGDSSGHDDQVDATVHLVNYAIRTGSNVFLLPSEWTPENVDSIMDTVPESMIQAPTTHSETNAGILAYISIAPSFHEQFYDETCGFCSNNNNGYCTIQHRNIALFDSCYEFTAREELANG
jgi:predicted phage terminase large subunit-like protein